MKLNEHDVRNIIYIARRDPFTRFNQIKVDLNLEYVCPRTIARSLSQYCGIYPYWSRRKPFISPINKKRRLKWAKQYRNWTIDEWRNLVWTDESPFVLRYQGPKRFPRLKSDRYKEKFMMGTVKHDKKINIWGTFSCHGVGHLHEIEGIMDAPKFKHILKGKDVPYQCRKYYSLGPCTLEAGIHYLELVQLALHRHKTTCSH